MAGKKRKTRAELETDLAFVEGERNSALWRIRSLEGEVEVRRGCEVTLQESLSEARQEAQVARAVYRCEIAGGKFQVPAEEADFVLHGRLPGGF